MILENKIINFLGDSITEGAGVTDRENCRYDNVIKNKCGLKEACNYGIGGTRIAYQRRLSDSVAQELFFCGRAYRLNPNADITVVFGGTNDYGHGDAPFGEITDKTADTYCGAVDYLMRTLLELYPKTKPVFMTPARRLGDEMPSINSNKGEDAKPLKEYAEVIKLKGKEYGIPVLDLYEALGLDPNDEEIRNKYAPDGLHFNDDGHKIIADLLIEFLENSL